MLETRGEFMKEYNKLVRDNIPEIIKADNKNCSIEMMDDNRYINALNQKLSEELNEYLESNEVEELADLEEVLLAIIDYKKIPRDKFEQLRKDKLSKRGGFKKRILLTKVMGKNE